MAHQEALTVLARIKPGQEDGLKRLLGTIAERIQAGQEWDLVPFPSLSNVHFARLVVFDAAFDLEGNPLPPQLGLLTNVDASLKDHIKDLATLGGAGLDQVFGHCEDYPETDAARNPASRRSFLEQHSVSAKAFYVNRQGRTVEQILQEQALWEAINGFLDGAKLAGQTPAAVRGAILDFVRSREDLAWALVPAARPNRAWQIRETLHQIGVALGVVLLSPLLLLSLFPFLMLLRRHEKRDKPDESSAPADEVRKFRADEDYWVHNQIIAVGLFKPGWFRRITTAVILGMTDYACRHVYNRGVLSGLNTIHFARWVSLDQGRRLFFSSNYDGSLESYMNDFIDKAAWGLNAIFSNGDGFPRTAFLFCKGITDEKAYKRFLPTRQVQSRVWYSAYPHLSTKNIANNAAIREGLSAQLGEEQTKVWLSRFGVGNQLPASGMAARFLDSIRWEKLCQCCK